MVSTIKIGDKNFNYQERNELPTLICIHGLGSNHKLWKLQIDALAKKCRVIAGDSPWRGKLELSAIPSEYSIKKYAQDWYRAMNRLKLKNNFILAAGMGSAIAFQIAIDHPDELKGMILVNARSYCDDDFRIWLKKWVSIVQKEGIDKLLDFVVPRFFTKHFIQENPELIDSYRKLRKEQCLETILLDCKALMNFDIRDKLKFLKMPVLLITGEYDVITPPFKSKNISEKLIKTVYVKIEKCGSMPFLEKPNEFNKLVIDFIDSTKQN